MRRAATKGLGGLHWSKLSVEQRSPAAEQALQTLLSVSQDPDWSIRYAAVVGLQALATTSHLKAQIESQLQQIIQTEPDQAVRARVRLAQQLLSAYIKIGQ